MSNFFMIDCTSKPKSLNSFKEMIVNEISNNQFFRPNLFNSTIEFVFKSTDRKYLTDRIKKVSNNLTLTNNELFIKVAKNANIHNILSDSNEIKALNKTIGHFGKIENFDMSTIKENCIIFPAIQKGEYVTNRSNIIVYNSNNYTVYANFNEDKELSLVIVKDNSHSILVHTNFKSSYPQKQLENFFKDFTKKFNKEILLDINFDKLSIDQLNQILLSTIKNNYYNDNNFFIFLPELIANDYKDIFLELTKYHRENDKHHKLLSVYRDKRITVKSAIKDIIVNSSIRESNELSTDNFNSYKEINIQLDNKVRSALNEYLSTILSKMNDNYKETVLKHKGNVFAINYTVKDSEGNILTTRTVSSTEYVYLSPALKPFTDHIARELKTVVLENYVDNNYFSMNDITFINLDHLDLYAPDDIKRNSPDATLYGIIVSEFISQHGSQKTMGNLLTKDPFYVEIFRQYTNGSSIKFTEAYEPVKSSTELSIYYGDIMATIQSNFGKK